MRQLLPLFILFSPIFAIGQGWTYEGRYANIQVPLDSVLLKNLTQDVDVVVYPDSTGHIQVGMQDRTLLWPGATTLLPGRPNPFHTYTTFGMTMERGGDVVLHVFDATGRSIAHHEARNLAPGAHGYQFNGPHAGIYFVSSVVGGERQVLRLIQLADGAQAELRYTGATTGGTKNGNREIFLWAPGDLVRHTAYATLRHCAEDPATHIVVDVPEVGTHYIMPLGLVSTAPVPCLVLDTDSVVFPRICAGDTSEAISFLVAGEHLPCVNITMAMNGFLFSLHPDSVFQHSVGIDSINNGTLDSTRVWVRANPQQGGLGPVTLELSCGSAQADLVLESPAISRPNTGGAVTRIWCSSAGMFDLFSLLDGTQTAGGEWTTNVSGVEITDEHLWDATGAPPNYYPFTYSVGSLDCSASITTVVIIHPSIDAGRDTTVTVCRNTPPFHLWNLLGGTQQENGNWTDPDGNPFGEDFLGMFDPSSDAPGSYTYTRHQLSPAPCNTDSATVTVNIPLCPTLLVDPGILDLDTVCVGLAMQWYQRHEFAVSGVDLAQGLITFGPVAGVGFTESPIGVLQPNLTLQWDGGTGRFDDTLFVGFIPATSGPFSIDIPISGGGATTTLTLTGVGSSAAPVAHLTGIAQDPDNTGQAILRGSYEDVGCSPVSSYGFEVSSDPSFEPHETYYASGDAALFTGSMPIQPSTSYWIRAFVQYNFIQKAYSAPISWTSPDGTTPTLNVVNTDVNVGSYCVGGRRGFSIFLTGQDLTAGVVEIGSSAGTFEFSLNMSEYTPTLTLVIQQDGTIPGTEVHVRVTVPNEGPWTGSISIAGGGATSTINVHGEGSTEVPEFNPVFPPSPDQINIMTAFSDGAPYAVIKFGEPLSCGTDSIRVEYSTTPEFQLGTGVSLEHTSQPFGYQAVVYDLLPGTRYYVVAAAESAQGQGSTDHYTFLTPLCPNSVQDRDGTTYSVIRIGDQCWTGENLRVTQYNDGTPIPQVVGNTPWIGQTAGAWCNYGNNVINDDMYGKLYNWYAAANGNLCPSGWHVPTDDDWQEMEEVLGVPSDVLNHWGFDRGSANNAGGKLKATTLWNSPNLGANNISVFTGLPGGYRFGGAVDESGNQPGAFYGLNATGWWWSSSAFTGDLGHVPPIPSDGNKGWVRLLQNSQQGISRFDGWKESGFSVRCIKD